VHRNGQSWLMTLLPFVIVAVVLGLRFRSMSKERPLKLSTLWLIPVLYLFIAGSMMFELPPPPLGWGLAVVGLGLGLVVGWYRGKMIHIERNAETGELRQRASPLAMILLAALVILKLGARWIFGEAAATTPGSNALLLTDAFLGFALGLLSATRLELYLRGQHLMAGAK
jgi:hypothetical protein